MEITEFDEQCPTPEAAKASLLRMIAQYRRGKETMGIVGAYENAAHDAGMTWAEVEACWHTPWTYPIEELS